MKAIVGVWRRLLVVTITIVAVAAASPQHHRAAAGRSSNVFARTATAIAKGAFKATGYGLKTAVGALRPTHVDLSDILTSWRINQEVSIGKGRQTITCPATVEFQRNGKVVTRYEGEEYENRFKFKQQKWPRHCTIEFEARAFQGPYDEKPVLKLYKGRFQRSLLNPSLITIKGKVYEPLAPNRRRAVRCGIFTATRRPTLPEVSLVDEDLDDDNRDFQHQIDADVHDDGRDDYVSLVDDDQLDGDESTEVVDGIDEEGFDDFVDGGDEAEEEYDFDDANNDDADEEEEDFDQY